MSARGGVGDTVCVGGGGGGGVCGCVWGGGVWVCVWVGVGVSEVDPVLFSYLA